MIDAKCNLDRILEQSLSSLKEGKRFDFKRQFDVKSKGEWCELLKDIAAFANSGGGILLIGLEGDGAPSGEDISQLLKLDPAQITDKINSYTNEQFDNFEIRKVTKDGESVVVIIIGKVSHPLVFNKQGNYTVDGELKTAFRKGTIYFRHGAKSEPLVGSDIRKFIDDELTRGRKEITKGLKKVVAAPIGSRISVVKPDEIGTGDGTTLRLTDDPSVPPSRIVDLDDTHPHRTMDVVKLLNENFEGKDVHKKVTMSDIVRVKKKYDVVNKPHFYHQSRFYCSPQYSQAFVDWLIEECKRDPLFFYKAFN